jgi:hypothetical protein
MAAAALESGATGQDLQWMAACGCNGFHPGNISRDLCARFLPKMTNRKPYEVHCSVQQKDSVSGQTSTQLVPQHILLPHEVLADVASSLDGSQILGTSQVDSFWKAFRASGALAARPNLEEACRQRMLPLVLHTDGAAYSDNGSLLQLSMRCMLSQGSISQTQFLLAAIPKSCSVEDTWAPVYDAIVSSLQSLYFEDCNYMGANYDHGRVAKMPPKAVVVAPRPAFQ